MIKMGLVAAVVGVGMVVAKQARGATTRPAASTQPLVEVSVDPRVELFSLICKLAGYPEYSQPRIPRYDQDVEKRFGSLRYAPVAKLARQLRDERSIGFDAPMSLAMHVSEPPELKLLVPLDPWPEDLDQRWTAQNAPQFLDAAREFAKDQKFQAFFDEHRAFYDLAARRLRDTLSAHANLQWFDSYFGARPGVRFHIYLGLMNGPSNYGSKLRTKGKEDDYCILGVWSVDRNGDPIFPADIVPTVIHEFAHSYMNPLVDRHEAELRNAGEKLFAPVANQMRGLAYSNWLTMMRESMVRVAVVRYRVANEGPLAGMAEVTEQVVLGFRWMPQLSALMAQYEAARDRYPTMESFMPRVVEFFNEYAKHQPPASAPAATGQ